MKSLIIIIALTLVGTTRGDDWSWGNNAKNVEAEDTTVDDGALKTKDDLVLLEENSAGRDGRTINDQQFPFIPEGVLPLEPVTETEEDGQARSARFLGIGNKLCKLGVKGMCEKQGYPPLNPSHYGDTLHSTYSNYAPQIIPVQGNNYPLPSYNKPPSKPFTKVFSSIFKPKKPELPFDSYGAPQPTYQQPKPLYAAPNPTYQAPYPHPKPVYKQPNKIGHVNHKPHYKPDPIYSAPQLPVKKVFSAHGAPKPIDVYNKPQKHLIQTHVVQPTKVQHLHSHTHLYNTPYDLANGGGGGGYPRDNGHLQSETEIKTTISTDPGYPPIVSVDSVPSVIGNNFIPTFNQEKRQTSQDISHFNTFGSDEQFQSAIDHLTSTAFGNNGFQNSYAEDCQCIPIQYCAPENLVARTNEHQINHLLDARNSKTDIVSNITANIEEIDEDDYYDYDYLHHEPEAKEISLSEDEQDNVETTTTISNDIEDEEYKETTTIETSSEKDRVKRDTKTVDPKNKTEELSGRQLTGFTPGSNGCGPNHVCCRRPVYVPAKRSIPVCGKGNPSIHGRVSNFLREDGLSDFGEYPWQAAILRDKESESMFVCGATLIDNYHVITAAHCVKDMKVEDLKVRLGEWDVNRDTEFYQHIEVPVLAIIIHPEFYKGNLYNDIAIVKMAKFVDTESNPHISTVCLPPPYTDFTNYRCYVTGWGKDAFGDQGKFQHILKELEIPIVDSYTCELSLQNTRLGRNYKLHDGFICAGGEEGKDACKGDGGGPLVCYAGDKTFQLAGIVSWGIGCGQKGIPGVYVNIPHYIDWINAVTRN